MAEQWKPGDVAMFPSGPALVFHRGDPDASQADNLAWMFADGSDMDLQPASFARRLVVIDPEDREQVERLWDLICERQYSQAGKRPVPEGWARVGFEDALREFANPAPPKPDEPSGLGAVVEDDTSDTWIRTLAVGKFGKPWRSESRQTNRAYADIDVVRVLSEGIS